MYVSYEEEEDEKTSTKVKSPQERPWLIIVL
jgi:hypothetical protein